MTRKADSYKLSLVQAQPLHLGRALMGYALTEQANKPAHAGSKHTQQGRREPLHKTSREPVYLPAKQIIPGGKEAAGGIGK